MSDTAEHRVLVPLDSLNVGHISEAILRGARKVFVLTREHWQESVDRWLDQSFSPSTRKRIQVVDTADGRYDEVKEVLKPLAILPLGEGIDRRDVIGQCWFLYVAASVKSEVRYDFANLGATSRRYMQSILLKSGPSIEEVSVLLQILGALDGYTPLATPAPGYKPAAEAVFATRASFSEFIDEIAKDADFLGYGAYRRNLTIQNSSPRATEVSALEGWCDKISTKSLWVNLLTKVVDPLKLPFNLHKPIVTFLTEWLSSDYVPAIHNLGAGRFPSIASQIARDFHPALRDDDREHEPEPEELRYIPHLGISVPVDERPW